MPEQTTATRIIGRLQQRGVNSKHLAQYLDKEIANSQDLVELYQGFISDAGNWYVEKKNLKNLDEGDRRTRRVQPRELPIVFADNLAKRICTKLDLKFHEISRGRGNKGIREQTISKLVDELEEGFESSELEF